MLSAHGACDRLGRLVPLLLAGAAARRPRERSGARRAGRTHQAPTQPRKAHAHPTAVSRPAAAELDTAGMVALTAAQAHPPTAGDFTNEAEQTALRLARHPHPADRLPQLSTGQCALSRAETHRLLGDVDTTLAARLAPVPCRQPSAAPRRAWWSSPRPARPGAPRCALTAWIAEDRPAAPRPAAV
ncbi:hypothetical protein ACGRHY_29390 [Streptomyces sp. HK10]|uniref:hypothetical protein n=1 Tax=Streptomyces sp. HK10 TaxID=3373255 RepID=UPI003749807A